MVQNVAKPLKDVGSIDKERYEAKKQKLRVNFVDIMMMVNNITRRTTDVVSFATTV